MSRLLLQQIWQRAILMQCTQLSPRSLLSSARGTGWERCRGREEFTGRSRGRVSVIPLNHTSTSGLCCSAALRLLMSSVAAVS